MTYTEKQRIAAEILTEFMFSQDYVKWDNGCSLGVCLCKG